MAFYFVLCCDKKSLFSDFHVFHNFVCLILEIFLCQTLLCQLRTYVAVAATGFQTIFYHKNFCAAAVYVARIAFAYSTIAVVLC